MHWTAMWNKFENVEGNLKYRNFGLCKIVDSSTSCSDVLYYFLLHWNITGQAVYFIFVCMSRLHILLVFIITETNEMYLFKYKYREFSNWNTFIRNFSNWNTNSNTITPIFKFKHTKSLLFVIFWNSSTNYITSKLSSSMRSLNHSYY